MPVSPGQVPDCVFYGDSATGTWSELATDDSGESTNLTAGTSSAYESSSSRVNLTSRRTVDIVLELDDYTTDEGALFTWDRGSGDYSRITWDLFFGSARIVVDINGGSGGSGTTDAFTLDNQPSANNETWVVSWAMEANPDTSGASDAMRSEIYVANVDNNTHEIFTFTHAAESGTSSGDLIFGAEDTSDTGAFIGTITEIRLSSRFHASAETYETFVSQSSAPTLVGTERKPFAVPPRTDVTLGNDGEFAGPIHALAAKASEQQQCLMWSPIVNVVSKNYTLRTSAQTETANGTQNIGLEDSGLGMYYQLQWLFRRPLPPNCNGIWGRVHVQHDAGAGSDDLGLYLFSMSQPGPVSKPIFSPPVFERYYDVQTVSTDHGNGAAGGEWVTFDAIPVARDNTGATYICLGVDLDTANSSSYRIHSLYVHPIFDPDIGSGVGSNGGLQFG